MSVDTQLDYRQKTFLTWLINELDIRDELVRTDAKLYGEIIRIISTNRYKSSYQTKLNELRDKYKEQYSNRNK